MKKWFVRVLAVWFGSGFAAFLLVLADLRKHPAPPEDIAFSAVTVPLLGPVGLGVILFDMWLERKATRHERAQE